MSDKTFNDWLKKYYPVDAETLTESTDEECIKHSILKWKGLSVLHKYGLWIDKNYYVVTNNDSTTLLEICGDTCALCCKHYDYDNGSCGACPLAESLGINCDDTQCNDDSLFKKSLVNPELMVNTLEKLLEKSE